MTILSMTLLRLFLTIASAALLRLAYPWSDIGWLTWFALVPLLCVLLTVRPRAAVGYMFIWAVVFYGLMTSYLRQFGILPWAAATLVNSAFFLPLALLVAHLGRCKSSLAGASAIAGGWVLTEWVHANAGPVAYTVGVLAHTQHDNIPLLQLASVTGELGISFLLVLANAALACLVLALARRTRTSPVHTPVSPLPAVLAAAVLVAAAACWGNIQLQKWHVRPLYIGPRKSVALIQGNTLNEIFPTAADVAENAETYFRLSRQAARVPVDLIIWPESALPVVLRNSTYWMQRVADLAKQTGAYILLGCFDEDEQGRLYNTATLISPEGNIVGRYAKRHLVIYGEYVPFRKQLARLLERYPIRRRDLTPGSDATPLPFPDMPLAVLICYESQLPALTRESVRRGGTAIAHITSEGWFGKSAEVPQHSNMAALRAVESRRYFMRVGTTGETCVIDPYGEVVASIPPFTTDFVVARLSPRQGLTLYMRLGDCPIVGISLIIVLVGLLMLWNQENSEVSKPAIET